MLRTVSVLACSAALLLPYRTNAQSAARTGGPEAGTWAAEASAGGGVTQSAGLGASLLRFLSPSTAIVTGFSFSRTDTEVFSTVGQTTTRFTSADSYLALQAGLRKYTRTGLGLRPMFGGGLLVTRQSFRDNTDGRVGAYGEAGAAWFFNPHVSLGVLGGISASRQDGLWNVGGSLARLTGTVYF